MQPKREISVVDFLVYPYYGFEAPPQRLLNSWIYSAKKLQKNDLMVVVSTKINFKQTKQFVDAHLKPILGERCVFAMTGHSSHSFSNAFMVNENESPLARYYDALAEKDERMALAKYGEQRLPEFLSKRGFAVSGKTKFYDYGLHRGVCPPDVANHIIKNIFRLDVSSQHVKSKSLRTAEKKLSAQRLSM